MIEGPNCVLCIPFILSGMLATYMRRMRNNILEIRIAGSSCRLQSPWCERVNSNIKCISLSMADLIQSEASSSLTVPAK